MPAFRPYKKKVYVCAILPSPSSSSYHIRSTAIHLFNYLSNERESECVCMLYTCACQLVRRSVNNIELFILFYPFALKQTHRHRYECTKIRDQVYACMDLIRLFDSRDVSCVSASRKSKFMKKTFVII